MSDSDDNMHEVESIIGRRVRRGKEKFLVKWQGFDEATWEPIEHLDNVIDMVIAFKQQEAKKKKVIDRIIGCGERSGQKFFLVRFRGAKENEIIDWETAKQYSDDVMEYFGTRLVWTSIDTIIDPENDDNLNEPGDQNNPHDQDKPSNNKDVPNMPSTSGQNSSSLAKKKPNDIEYYSSSSD